MKSKITLFAMGFATGLASTIALAQEQTPPPDTASATQQSAHQMPTGDPVDMGRFCPRHAIPLYPAWNHRSAGGALLECALDAQVRPETCWIISEEPQSSGLGQAALRVACLSREHSHIDPAHTFAVEGDDRPHVRMPVRFEIAGQENNPPAPKN